MTSLFRYLGSRHRREPHALAEFVGNNEAGVPEWEIEGSIYSGTVTVVGGGYPVVGRRYVCHFGCPDTRRDPLVVITRMRGAFPVPEPLEFSGWPTFLQSPGRGAFSASAPVFQDGAYSTLWPGLHGFFGLPKISSTDAVFGVGQHPAVGGVYKEYLLKLSNTPWTEEATPAEYDGDTGIVEYILDDDVYVVEWESGVQRSNIGRKYHPWTGDTPGTRSRISRLSRNDLSTVWHSDWIDEVVIRQAPSLVVMGSRLVALAEGIDNGKLFLYQVALDKEDGGELTVTKLPYDNPEFVALSTAIQISWRSGEEPSEYVSTALDPAIWEVVCFPEERYRARLSAVYNRSPLYGIVSALSTGRVSQGLINCQATFDHPMPSIGVITNWLCSPALDVHVPCQRRGHQIVGFDSDGAAKWAVKGWEQDPETRELYSPLVMRSNGQMLVLVERISFHTGSLLGASIDFDISYWLPEFFPSYKTAYDVSLTTTDEYHYRIIKSAELFFDVVDASSGARLSREPIGEQIVGKHFVPEGAPTLWLNDEDRTKSLIGDFGNNFASGAGLVGGRLAYSGQHQQPWPNYTHFDDETGSSQVMAWSLDASSATVGAGAVFNPPGTVNATLYMPFAAVWNAPSMEISTYGPLPFDPYSATLSLDEETIMFAPVYHNFWSGSVATSNGGGHIQETGSNANGPTFSRPAWVSSRPPLYLEARLVAFGWDAKQKWDTPVIPDNSLNWYWSHFYGFSGNRAAITWRKGTTQFLRIVNCANGASLEDLSWPVVAGSGVYNTDLSALTTNPAQQLLYPSATDGLGFRTMLTEALAFGSNFAIGWQSSALISFTPVPEEDPDE